MLNQDAVDSVISNQIDPLVSRDLRNANGVTGLGQMYPFLPGNLDQLECPSTISMLVSFHWSNRRLSIFAFRASVHHWCAESATYVPV
jgi:hypothetical protein